MTENGERVRIWLSPRAAAALLERLGSPSAVSAKTLVRWCRRGRIAHARTASGRFQVEWPIRRIERESGE